MRLRTGVVCALKYWANHDLGINQNIKNLSQDIINSPQHVFGNHENCHEYRTILHHRKKAVCTNKIITTT